MQDDIKKRDKIIHVFGKILDINQEEINKVNNNITSIVEFASTSFVSCSIIFSLLTKVLGRKDSAWLSNILWPTVAPPSSPTTPTNEQVGLVCVTNFTRSLGVSL